MATIKKAKASSNHLILKVPNNIEDFYSDGLVVPDKLASVYAEVPLDFTSISSREVGFQHSYWAVRHSYLIYLIGVIRAEVGNLKHDLRNLEAEKRIKYYDRFKNKYLLNDYVANLRSVSKLRNRLIQVEGRLTRYEALSEAYVALREASSREITRRNSERASKD